jgi:DtxR family transcriptional regulator, Mn-dependent transcriptional regulator
MVSATREDYLKKIFELSAEKNRAIKTKELASSLNVSSSSVTEMISKLSLAGLVENEPYYGFSLTKKGIVEAFSVLRKHRLLEKFLVETLGLAPEDVHVEAHRLEHVVSDEALDKIDRLLKSPCYCPHRSRIPPKNKKIVSLDELPNGSEAKIVFSRLKSSKTLDRLNSMGLVPQARISLVRKLKRGPIIINVCGSKIAIDREIASQFFVEI